MSATALVGVLTFPVAASAQTTAPIEKQKADQAQTPGEEDNDNAEIVVTGTRIKGLPNLTSFEPTVTLTRQYLDERNLTNVADALNELPIFRGSVTPNGAQGSFGQGVNFVNAFGLGSNRTLTLVNGRRFVSSNVTTQFNQGSQGTQVDLNVINSLLIDRTDVVDIGGAPVYGSDAIAGTVNIILKDRVKGVTLSATDGITEQGDGHHYSISGLAGHDFIGGRANITLAYQHDQQDGVLYNARDYLRDNLGGATNPTTAQAAALGRGTTITAQTDGRVNTGFGYNNSATDGFPGTIQIKNETIYQLTPGGLLTSATGNAAAALNYQFDASGNLVPFNKGIIFPSIYASGGDGFKFNDYSQIQSQLNRDVVNGFAHFDVSDGLKFFFEGEYFHSRGDELVQQPTFNSTLFSGTSGALTFASTSPFLTPQAKAQLAALGVTRFTVSRASSDLADLTGYSTTNLIRFVGGARGDFNVGSRKFNYEVSGNFGRTRINDTSQDINAQNFINAVNVTTNAAGQIVCTTTPAIQAAPGGTPVADPKCVPLNLLGYGLSSQAARDYVIAQNVTKSVLTQYDFVANVNGSPFSLFGNEVGISAGYEHRQEEGSFTPSAFQQAGLGRSVAITPLAGKYNLDEVFGEAQVPLITPDNNLSFVNQLSVFARGRYVDSTTNGGFFSWAAGGVFAPIRDIAFRGNFTKSFRAPAITELFLPVSGAFSAVPDLCSAANINAGSAPAIRAANCAAFLKAYPNATPLDAMAATVPITSGGNPKLLNESSKSFTVGIKLEPRFIPGLSITADYVSIHIANPITTLAVATIASACFDNASFNAADPANGNAFCSLIHRYPTGTTALAVNGGSAAGQVINNPATPGVTATYINGKRYIFTGIQGGIDYTRTLAGLGLPGRVGIDSTFLYVRRRLNDITGVAPLRTDGTFGDPKFSALFNLRYLGEVFGETTSVVLTGKQIATRAALSLDLREFNTIDAFATINQSVYLNVNKKFRLTLSVTNLFNHIGQQYLGYYPTALINDYLGRRFTAGVRAEF